MRKGIAGVVSVFALASLTLWAPGAKAAVTCAPAVHAGGEWPVFGHDSANTRNQADEHVIGADNVGGLASAWVFSVAASGGSGTFESTPMVADGCVFIATQTGSVFAVNADSGELVWKQQMPYTVTTLSVANGRVFADVSEPNKPAMAALDEFTGDVLWSTVLDTQKGSDTTGSPVAFGDMVMTGISCIGAEGASGGDRLACRGSFAILDQASGDMLAHGYGISDEDYATGQFSGGGMWAAPAIDEETGYAYIGAGNPFVRDHPRTAALLKIDVDPGRTTFGTVVDSYKGTPEQYFPVLGARKPACEASDFNFAACELPDLDMAMAANIWRDSYGHKLVGTNQGSGIFHAVTADTMEQVWTTLTGPITAAGRSGGSAFDGTKLYVNGGSPGQVWALEKDYGDPQWVAPTADGSHSWTPVAYANGVVYTPNERDMLFAYDASSGSPLLIRPVQADVTGDVLSGNQATGVSIARNTVFVPANGSAGGYVVAYRLP
jgi:outer membrane protein assembly factor BamB